MLSTLDVPYVDTSAAELVWTLDHPLAPGLATTVTHLDHLGGQLELRVLGASHQAVLRWADGEIVETVACLPGQRPYLPETTERRAHGRHYRFRARVDDVDASQLRTRAGSLRRLAEQDGTRGSMVLAAFPSDPAAVTALSLTGAAAAVSWTTWHVYPNSGQIVTTSTEVR